MRSSARKMGISLHTIRIFRVSLYRKLGANGMAQAVYLAMKKGVLL